MNDYLKYVQKLKALSVDGVYTMEKIEWWLAEYEEYYYQIKDGWFCRRCKTQIGLPCICEIKSEEYIFIELCEHLDHAKHCHRKENYFKQEIEKYHSIKDNGVELKKWLLNNMDLKSNKYYSGFSYLHDLNNNPFISLYIPSLKDWFIYVERKDFKYNIEFSKLFSGYIMLREMYDEDEIVQQIDKVMCQLKNINEPLKEFLFNK